MKRKRKNRSKTRLTLYERIKRKILTTLKRLIFLFLIGCIGIILLLIFHKDDTIKLNDTEIKLYIDSADKISKGKLQVNWKYLAAIDYVRYKKDISKSTDVSIQELGQTFLENTSKENKYKLLNLEDGLKKLSFTDSEKEKAYKYVEQLDSIGLVPNNLRKDSSSRKFIDELSPKAIELYNNYGILPSITISQAILESNWGKSDLSVQANNLFGIKADNSWKGKKVTMTTSEYYNSVIKDNFRSYSTKSESLDDYGKFILNNKRYKENGVFNSSQYIDQAQSMENAGYSTKQDETGNNIYADLLIDIIKENNLQLIDSKVQSQS
ncbi:MULTISPECIES: glucosaminidase domain-containing protein [Clostridium]|uniref:Glucosaminidase domain-containing protein n=1 Tax=Clostridium cibarium TaxID=2762247 RepID=A0ABR8PUS7_9CLOT|nr:MULTISPECIES: glucosaminidase domain-containing protein [Clostridium]MBD7911888.1 glucosaminidase domain-containing protein [Clostridium cibarium]